MALPLMFWELGKFIIEEKLFNFEAVALGAADVATAGLQPQAEPLLQSTGAAGPKVGVAADRAGAPIRPTSDGWRNPCHRSQHTGPVIIDAMRAVTMPMRDLPEWGTEVRNEEDNVFRIYVIQLEHDIMLYERIKDTVFSWFFDLIVRIDVLVFLAGQLCRRTTGTLVSRAWKAIDRMYHYRQKQLDMSKDDMVELGCLMLEAWAARAHALRDLGLPAKRRL